MSIKRYDMMLIGLALIAIIIACLRSIILYEINPQKYEDEENVEE